MPRLGKFGPELMANDVYPNLGARSPDVLVGPGRGLDNAVLAVGKGRVMIVTTDPVSMIPKLGMKVSAWLSVHLLASDYATSGNSPTFATFDFNFPPEASAEDVAVYLREVGAECKNLGVSIVAGNTGRYPGSGYTVVGGGTLFGFANRAGYLSPAMARAGDVVMATKGAAIEATAMLANSFPRYLESRVGRRVVQSAKRYLLKCTTVEDAILAAEVGIHDDGVTSMHDATEGGVLGGLCEMAEASGRSFLVDPGRIRVPPEAVAVCSAFGIDPLASVSEGTLLLTISPASSEAVVARLKKAEIPCFEIGRVGEGPARVVFSEGGRRRIVRAVSDPYWPAYARAVRSSLR